MSLCLIFKVEIQQMMDKKSASFRPYGMHGRSGFAIHAYVSGYIPPCGIGR